MDKLSILISSYNRSDLIGRSIGSILGSNIPQGLVIEIVIVDDQSDEKTWEVLEGYKNDPRFIIYRNERKTGAGGPNWNKAFELSSGNIIINNEDDMIWHKDYIKILYNELKKHDRYTCIFGMYIQCSDPDDLRPPKTRPTNPHPRFGFFTGIPRKYTDGTGEHVSHNQFFCYREFFDGLDELWHHYPGTGLREETDLYLRILKLKPPRKFITMPEAYLWHVYSKTGKNVRSIVKIRKGDSKNHEVFLRRNFGRRAPFMIIANKIYNVQKAARDLLGGKFLEPIKSKKHRKE